MFWDDNIENCPTPPSNINDHVFQLLGRSLPYNYLCVIHQFLEDQSTHWGQQSSLSFYLKISSEEGNGWFRNTESSESIFISRRNSLVIRAAPLISPLISRLTNSDLNIHKHPVSIKFKHSKRISPSATLYAQHVVSSDENEQEFLERIMTELKQYDISCSKLLCGKRRTIVTEKKTIFTRSLLLDGLSKEDSIVIQSNGLGNRENWGCGVFVPYKSIK